MQYHTLYSFLKTFLALRKVIISLETERISAQKYDKPCCNIESQEKEALFLLFSLENMNCFDDLDKVIKKANRLAKNCGNCSVSDDEAYTFSYTTRGRELALRYNNGGFLLTDGDAFYLQQNGFRILL
jgi:hypothetical protein